jgi:hypothetical protein
LIPENDWQAIEEAFSLTWDAIEQYYAFMLNHPRWEHIAWMKPLLDLIAELRNRGYDRYLRAGQSVSRLVLSRSLSHGLRDEQPSFGILLQPSGGMQLIYDEYPDVHIEMDVDRVEITPEVEDFLNRLLEHPID